MKLAGRQSYPSHLLIYNLLYPSHCVYIWRTLYKDRRKVGHHHLFLQCPLIYHSPPNLILPRAKADRAVWSTWSVLTLVPLPAIVAMNLHPVLQYWGGERGGGGMCNSAHSARYARGSWESSLVLVLLYSAVSIGLVSLYESVELDVAARRKIRAVTENRIADVRSSFMEWTPTSKIGMWSHAGRMP